MKYKIEFMDIFEDCESKEQAIDALLEYLNECVKYEDVTAFNFTEIAQ